MVLDVGLLVLRLVVGALLFAHGAQKLFGWFGGPGLASATGMMGAHLRLRPAPFWAFLGSFTEVAGGLLLAVGLLSPLGAIAIAAAMMMALTVHWPRFWAQNGGIEYPLLLLLAALGIGLTGPGQFALDAAFGIALPVLPVLLVGLVLAVVGVAVALATRAPAAIHEPVAPEAARQAA
jgi:putative oxidoreductase